MTNTLNIKEAVSGNRILFDHLYDAGVAVHNESKKVLQVLVDKAGWLDEDAKNRINNLTEVYQQERDRLKSFIDTGFDNLLELVEMKS